LTPNFIEDVANEKAAQKNVDDTAAQSNSAFTEQSDRTRTSLPVKVRRANHTRRKQANDDMTGTRRNAGRRAGNFCGRESISESILGSVPKSVTESISVVRRQTSSSRSPGVSPKSTMSSDRLSQDTSSSAVTVDYDEDDQCPTDIKVLEGRCEEPTFTDVAAHQRQDCSPDSSMCNSSPLDEGKSDRLDSENDEDRRKTTSCVQLDGVQSATATNSGQFLVDQSSANVAIDYTVTQEDIEHLGNSGQVVGLEVRAVVPGMSVSGQTRTPPGEHHDGDSNCAVQTSDIAQRGSVDMDHKPRKSVVVTRRRRTSKPTDIFRRQPADQANKPNDELAVYGMASPALQNGVKPSSDDEDRAL